mmetsp:Transcript_16984/g.41456  ORF Transcript_16984/g.41456 Transcript_16984/m.41456 type:complete len:208 (-) Transcript_16984:349-972(-)
MTSTMPPTLARHSIVSAPRQVSSSSTAQCMAVCACSGRGRSFAGTSEFHVAISLMRSIVADPFFMTVAAFTCAPRAASRRMHSHSPWKAAMIRGVKPSLSRASRSAPKSRSTSTTSGCPHAAAKVNTGICPVTPALWFGSAPCSSRLLTDEALPLKVSFHSSTSMARDRFRCAASSSNSPSFAWKTFSQRKPGCGSSSDSASGSIPL